MEERIGLFPCPTASEHEVAWHIIVRSGRRLHFWRPARHLRHQRKVRLVNSGWSSCVQFLVAHLVVTCAPAFPQNVQLFGSDDDERSRCRGVSHWRNSKAKFLQPTYRKTRITIMLSWLVFQSELVRLRPEVWRRLYELRSSLRPECLMCTLAVEEAPVPVELDAGRRCSQ